ncbi:MAG: hypothetical protein WCA14_09195 [Steroidobacteraceae bacterium]
MPHLLVRARGPTAQQLREQLLDQSVVVIHHGCAQLKAESMESRARGLALGRRKQFCESARHQIALGAVFDGFQSSPTLERANPQTTPGLRKPDNPFGYGEIPDPRKTIVATMTWDSAPAAGGGARYAEAQLQHMDSERRAPSA